MTSRAKTSWATPAGVPIAGEWWRVRDVNKPHPCGSEPLGRQFRAEMGLNRGFDSQKNSIPTHLILRQNERQMSVEITSHPSLQSQGNASVTQHVNPTKPQVSSAFRPRDKVHVVRT